MDDGARTGVLATACAHRLDMPDITTDSNAPAAHGGPRRALRTPVLVATLLLVSTVAIGISLQITPEQSASALGQTVTVGAATPTIGLSGPGEVVLFGQTLPTQVDFIGPVRPRLVLTNITISEQVAGLFGASDRSASDVLGGELEAAWRRYFAWEIAIVAVTTILLFGAITGWRRFDPRRTLVTLIGGLLFVEAVNLGAVMVTAYTAPGILRDVRNLSELVGREERAPLPPAPGPAQLEVEAIVMGDSTASGIGGPSLPDATPADVACQRSTFAFALALARVNDWNVRNLACSGATVPNGLLGRQFAGGRWLAPQIAVAKRAVNADVVVVNIGANDMRWGLLVRLCAASPDCDDRAQSAYFKRNLDDFASDYYDLLRELTALPGNPRVLIVQYYTPFDPTQDCLSPSGLTPEKIEVLLDRLDALNAIIGRGAETFGFGTVRPDLTGHELCAEQPYVQGFDDPAPLHPNARGQLVLALTIERALLGTP